jgi:hypothetical protein
MNSLQLATPTRDKQIVSQTGHKSSLIWQQPWDKHVSCRTRSFDALAQECHPHPDQQKAHLLLLLTTHKCLAALCRIVWHLLKVETH